MKYEDTKSYEEHNKRWVKWKTKIKPLHKIGKALFKVRNSLERKYDYVWMITGETGSGKSRGLLLNIIDYWNKIFDDVEPSTDCLSTEFGQYITSLASKERKPQDIITLDEAGDTIDKGSAGEKKLIDLYQTYTIIREKLFFAVWCMPSIFDVSTKFATRRIKGWLHVIRRVDNKCKNCGFDFVGNQCPQCNSKDFKNGFIRYAFFNKKRLKEIIQINQYRLYKNIWVGIDPLFESTIRQYNGSLDEYYSELKSSKMDQKLNELQKKYGVDGISDKIRELSDKGKSQRQIAKELGITHHKVRKTLGV